MENGDNGGGTVHPLKSEGNIYQHARQRIESRENRLAAQLRADFRTDDFNVANREIAEGETVIERHNHLRSDAIDIFQLVEVRDDAAVISVARVEQSLRELVVAVSGIGAQRERIFLGQVGSEQILSSRH